MPEIDTQSGSALAGRPPLAARIPARSQRQAMDWSLVLASQGIDCAILRCAEDRQWSLEVAPPDHDRALASIRQYRLENRRWGWRRELPWPEISFHWGGLSWCLLTAIFFGLGSGPETPLYQAGMMDSRTAAHGEPWRLFTSILLHADLGHLMANLTTGFIVLGLAMARYGAGCALFTAFVAGAGGNLLGLLLYPRPYQGVGASGMVMGGLGLLAVHSISLWRQSPQAAKFILSGVSAGVMLFVLFGLDPASDVVAHLGGFVSGMLLGTPLALLPPRLTLDPKANLAWALASAALVIGAWGLALR